MKKIEITEIRMLAQRLTELEQDVRRLENASKIARSLGLKARKKQLAQVRQRLDIMLKLYLEQNDLNFKKIASLNHKILVNDTLNCSPQFLPYTAAKAGSDIFLGQVLPSGEAILEYVKKLGKGLPKKYYISKFLGKIDYLGNIELKVLNLKQTILNQQPTLYLGAINEQGIITLKADTKKLKVCETGVVISKLECPNVVSDTLLKNFLENREQLLRMIENFKNEILSD